jgi:hypothetical protein
MEALELADPRLTLSGTVKVTGTEQSLVRYQTI